MHDENGQLFSLPAAWTDAVAADPFVVVAAGRCAVHHRWPAGASLTWLDRFGAQRDGDRAVKKITP